VERKISFFCDWFGILHFFPRFGHFKNFAFQGSCVCFFYLWYVFSDDAFHIRQQHRVMLCRIGRTFFLGVFFLKIGYKYFFN